MSDTKPKYLHPYRLPEGMKTVCGFILATVAKTGDTLRCQLMVGHKGGCYHDSELGHCEVYQSLLKVTTDE